jgi:maleate isomerase
MAKRTFLGMLTPSSNTVLEPTTTAMLAGLPEVSAHFSRFKVTEIALGADALAQFDDGEILRAAELLAHAKVNVIAWNGTSSSWLGFDRDWRLCQRIEAATGIAACTAVLAINELFERSGAKRIGLVTPYVDDVQARILANYQSAGYAIADERHLGLHNNYSFCNVSADQICTMIREIAASRPHAIAVVCTNMRGAPVAAALEGELAIPIYDSVSATVWKSLRIAGADPARVRGWGSMFSL